MDRESEAKTLFISRYIRNLKPSFGPQGADEHDPKSQVRLPPIKFKTIDLRAISSKLSLYTNST